MKALASEHDDCVRLEEGVSPTSCPPNLYTHTWYHMCPLSPLKNKLTGLQSVWLYEM